MFLARSGQPTSALQWPDHRAAAEANELARLAGTTRIDEIADARLAIRNAAPVERHRAVL